MTVDVGKVIDTLFPAAIIGVAGLVVWFLKQIHKDLSQLNVKIAIFGERVNKIDSEVDDHESRIRSLEYESIN